MEFNNWRKSTRSGDANANCVEVATDGDHVALRESDVPGEIVVTTRAKFQAFLEGAKAGEFDDV